MEKNRHIDNLVGFIITAIKEGYQAPISKDRPREKTEPKTSFHNFPERHTDYDALFSEKKRHADI